MDDVKCSFWHICSNALKLKYIIQKGKLATCFNIHWAWHKYTKTKYWTRNHSYLTFHQHLILKITGLYFVLRPMPGLTTQNKGSTEVLPGTDKVWWKNSGKVSMPGPWGFSACGFQRKWKCGSGQGGAGERRVKMCVRLIIVISNHSLIRLSHPTVETCIADPELSEGI